MNNNPNISIVILNYNGGQDLSECIESVMKIDYPNYEVIVVDNGSTDNSISNIRERFPRIKIIENKHNLGFPAGNNVGIRESTTPYVLLLNDDVVVGRDILKDLLSAIKVYPQAGVIGPAILYYKDPEYIWAAGGKISLFGYTSHIDKGRKSDTYDIPRYVDYITGCAVLIKREVIDSIGLLDPDYFLYFDDADYCYRAKRAGFKCLYIPPPTVRHKTGDEWITNPTQAYHYMKNAFVFAKKNLVGVKKFIFIASQVVLLFPYYSIKLIGKDTIIFRSLVKGLKDGISYKSVNE